MPEKTDLEEIHKILEGPTLILAGPGTGKTHRVALRVKWLVEEKNFSPDDITVITFTTEAALNMRHRLSDEDKKDVYMPREKQPNQISTMHSLGQQIITRHLAALGLSEEFKIVESDSLRRLLFEDAAQIAGLERVKGIQALSEKQRAVKDGRDELTAVRREYDQILRSCNAIDFDDQLIIARELLLNNPELLAEYQKKARHLLIDEYQDINRYQFELIKLLSSKNPDGLFAVGDDDQSIYSFRGGSPEYVRNFREHFGKKANIRYLSECRRCPPVVLNAAIALVKEFNPERAPKPDPVSLKESQTPIQLLDSPTQEKEAYVIASKCYRVTPSHDVLVLVPHLKFAKPIVNALRRKHIGYDCRAIVSEEGLDMLDNLGDWLADQSASFALRHFIDFLLEADHFGVPSKLVRKDDKKVLREKMLSQVSDLWKYVVKKRCSLYESLKANTDHSQLLSSLHQTLGDLISMYENPPDNFLEVVGRIRQPWKSPRDMFEEVSTWIDEVRGRGASGKSNVRIMSMQMAKGLEADYVFVIGMDDQIIPRHGLSDEQLQETSRLTYVSMTRAKVELWLCHARTRSAAITRIQNSFALKTSPFLKAIPKELMNTVYILGQAASKNKGKKVK